MAAALLLRGHSHRDVGVLRSWGIDWRKSIASHRKYLISPLREMYGPVSIFLSSYNTPHRLEVEADYNPVHVVWKDNGTQKTCAVAGLETVCRYSQDWEMVVVCRFDLEIKGNPFTHPGFKRDKVNWLWKEWTETAWNDHRRVPDALHFLPGKYLAGLTQGIKETPSDICLHTIYRPVAKHVGEENINIMEDKYVDSNTDIQENIFYRMVRVY